MAARLKGPERATLRFEMRTTRGFLSAADDLKLPGESRADVVRRAMRDLYRRHRAEQQATAGRSVVAAAMNGTDQ
jgi:hypothetical protein